MIRIFKKSLSSSSDSPEGLTAELGQQTSPGRRGFGPKSSGHRSPGGGASILANKRLTLPFLAFVAVLAAGLLFLLPGGSLHAQQNLQVVEYDENGTGPVLTLTARDPEGVAPVVWSLLAEIGTPPAMIGDTALDAADIADRGKFNISSAGVLTFKTPPSYEDDSESGGGNKNYQVVVQATDRGAVMHRNWFKVTVKVEDVEEPGKVTLSHLQPQVGVPITASVTDPDGPAADITATGWKWYRSSNMNGPWTEISGATAAAYTPKDDAGDDDRNKYLRAVATYNDSRPAEYGTKEAAGVSVHRVSEARTNNTAPTFSQTAVDRNIPENTKADVKIGAPVSATDPDTGDVLVYTLGGAGTCSDNENACFSIDRATGQLMTKEKLDSDTKDSYSVMVTATDSSNEATDPPATVTISITDIDEAPTFQSDAVTAKDIMENASGDDLMVGEYTGTDPEGGTVTLSLSGADMSKFELTDPDPVAAGNKVLSFKDMPDFEAKADSNKDNVYEVTVEASDGSKVGRKNVTVKVINDNEDGKATLSGSQPAIGTEITATLADEDGFVPDTVTWTWYRLDAVDEPLEDDPDNTADFNAIPKAKSATYTPVADDDGKFLKAMASYADMSYDMLRDATSDASAKVAVDPVNKRPEFDDGTSTDRYVMEGTGGPDASPTIIAGPVGATDPNKDSLAYTLGGADAGSFMMRADDSDTPDMNEHDGSIRVKDGVKLDHEKKARYTVTVTANDGRGETSSTARITVNIMVTDMDEKPMIMDRSDSTKTESQVVEYDENGTGPVLTLTARDPEGVAPVVWSLLAEIGTPPAMIGRHGIGRRRHRRPRQVQYQQCRSAHLQNPSQL